jgi:hypothetical protein
MQLVALPMDKGLEPNGEVAMATRGGGWPPASPTLHAVVPRKHRDDDGEIRRDCALTAELPERCVVVLDQLELDPRRHIGRFVSTQPLKSGHLGGDSVDLDEVLEKRRFWRYWSRHRSRGKAYLPFGSNPALTVGKTYG